MNLRHPNDLVGPQASLRCCVCVVVVGGEYGEVVVDFVANFERCRC